MSGIFGIAIPGQRLGAEALSGVFSGFDNAEYNFAFSRIDAAPKTFAGRVLFSADKGNATFGASDTVQPKTLRAQILIRYE